jgi:glutamyl-tRNA synthetase
LSARATPRGRFAPSPTGEVHLGNAASALVAWLSVRAQGGTFVMRMEDLDRSRVRPGLAAGILRDLAWLGLDWDEGPDRGGPHAPYDQSARLARYRAAFESLADGGLVYPCFCSRREIRSSASAPQEPGDEPHYPGHCAGLDPRAARRRVESGERHAWRFRVGAAPRPEFDDRVRGRSADDAWPCGDFVVHRSDGVAAYQLAVVVDDAEMEIAEVVRGADLFSSTRRQLLLYEALGRSAPIFGHVPLLLGPDGVRLSKRHDGITLRELRERGLGPEAIVGRLAALLGLRPEAEPLAAPDLVADFDWRRLRSAPPSIAVDPTAW